MPPRNNQLPALQTFAQRLRFERKKRRWSRKALAGAAGISPMTIASYEAQRTMPKLDSVKRLADTFGVSTDYLIGRSSLPNPVPASLADIDREWGNGLLQVLRDGRNLSGEDKEAICEIIGLWVRKARRGELRPPAGQAGRTAAG